LSEDIDRSLLLLPLVFVVFIALLITLTVMAQRMFHPPVGQRVRPRRWVRLAFHRHDLPDPDEYD